MAESFVAAGALGWGLVLAGQQHTGKAIAWIGMGAASAFRNNLNMKAAVRVRLARDGMVTIETDMTDIGTGTYTILAQTAAEMLGLPFERVDVRLGDSAYPVSAGSGGQWGANSSTAAVYAACVKLREQIAAGADMDASRPSRR